MLTLLCDKCGAHENYPRIGELEEVLGNLRSTHQSFPFAMTSIEKREMVLCRKCLVRFMDKLDEHINKTNQELLEVANEEVGMETKIISLDDKRERRTSAAIEQAGATVVDNTMELTPIELPDEAEVKIGTDADKDAD